MNGTETAVDLTTNCGLGPGCGMIPALKVMAVVAFAVFVLGMIKYGPRP